MQTQKANPQQWVAVVATVLLLIGSFTWFWPTSDEVTVQTEKVNVDLTEVLNELNNINEKIDKIPTDNPDTFLSTRNEAKKVAEDLALEEIEENDFVEDLVDFIIYETEAEDFDEDDVTEISVRDVDVYLTFYETANVEVEMKVYFNNFGDNDEEEHARVLVNFNVEDLVYDDDYEDAEVDNYSFVELVKDSF